MTMESSQTLEDVVTLASQEVSKAIILEERPIAMASAINVISRLEENFLGSKENVGTQEDKMTFTVSLDDTLHNKFKGSGLALEENVEDCLPLEEMVKRLGVEVSALRKKRSDEGRANEKVVSIFSSREQAWKAERRRLMNEQRRLWQELQRAFMDQEVLRQRTQQLAGVHEEGDFEFTCEECEQREGWLLEMKERLQEQEFVILASAEEAKAERLEKNTLAAKVTAIEVDLSNTTEKLRLEEDARILDRQKHETALTELTALHKITEMEKAQALHDVEDLQKHLSDLTLQKKHFEELVTQMSLEVHMLQIAAQEREDIISAMLKKADADAEERHELERELSIIKAKFLHVESEREKWQKYMGISTPSSAKEAMNPRRSFGSKQESGLDKMRELQRLHDAEVRDLQSAFEDEVSILRKRLSLFQERVADLEENILLRMAKNVQCMDSFQETSVHIHAERIKGLRVFHNYVEDGRSSEQFELSVAKTQLRQYMEIDGQRESEIEKWKKAYFASKATIEMLHKERGYTVSSPKSRGLGDWLELERARSKMEQRHLQEVNAFERQLKARDERMEAFRQQLLTMESEAERRESEIKALKRDLQKTIGEKV